PITGPRLPARVTVIVKLVSAKAPSESVTRTVNNSWPLPAAVQLNRPSSLTVAPAGPDTSEQVRSSKASSTSLANSVIETALPSASLRLPIGEISGSSLTGLTAIETVAIDGALRLSLIE